jgi:hypothetical protein
VKLLETNFPASLSRFSGGEPIQQDIVAKQLAELGVQTSRLEDLFSESDKVIFDSKNSDFVLRSDLVELNFEEKIYNSLVSLKVAVSKYAMHLSPDERHRIFMELDSVINKEDWHENDQLPQTGSFQDFLKWMIYSKYFKWTSIGVSDDGSILVAWKTEHGLLTANFTSVDNVRWTAQIKSDVGEIGHTVGRCPLRLFAQQAAFYLEGARHNEVDQRQ